jgi:hypothetical protein
MFYVCIEQEYFYMTGSIAAGLSLTIDLWNEINKWHEMKWQICICSQGLLVQNVYPQNKYSNSVCSVQFGGGN